MTTTKPNYLFASFLALLLAVTNIAYAESFEENRKVSAFTRIEVGGLAHVELIKGDKHQVEIWAKGIALNDILTKSTKDRLVVTTQGNHRGEKIRIQITYVELEEIKTNGAAYIKATDAITANTLSIFITDNGDAVINLNVKNLHVDMRGNGNLTLKGLANKQYVNSHGGGGSLNNTDLKN